MNLVCSQCAAINRLPTSKLPDKPICGRCKQTLLPTMPVELTDQNFDKFISRSDLPVIVDFWASWCGPCRMMAPAFEAAAGLLSPRMILAKLNTETSPKSSTKLSISGIPTIIMFHRGTEIARQSGALDTQQIVTWANSAA